MLKTLTYLARFNRSDKTLECRQFLQTYHSLQLSLVQPTDLWQRRQLAAFLPTHQVQKLSIVRRLTDSKTTNKISTNMHICVVSMRKSVYSWHNLSKKSQCTATTNQLQRP